MLAYVPIASTRGTPHLPPRFRDITIAPAFSNIEVFMHLAPRYYRCLLSDGFLGALLIFGFLWVVSIQRSIAMPNSHNSALGTFEAGQGVSLHYEVSGKCNAQKWIFLVHGLGASTEDWADVRDQLGEESCVMSLDLKGHGQSSRPKDGDYSLDTQADL